MKTSLILALILVMFVVVAAAVAGVIVLIVVMVRKNSRAPKITTDAVVVSKHMSITPHHNPVAGDVAGVHGHHVNHTTNHHAVFRTADGAELELSLNGTEYDALNEGASGKLTYKGTWFLGFEER